MIKLKELTYCEETLVSVAFVTVRWNIQGSEKCLANLLLLLVVVLVLVLLTSTGFISSGSVLQCKTGYDNTVQYSTVQYSTVQYSIIQYNTITHITQNNIQHSRQPSIRKLTVNSTRTETRLRLWAKFPYFHHKLPTISTHQQLVVITFTVVTFPC